MNAPTPPKHIVTWHDNGREPQVAPDPAYPSGRDILLPLEIAARCTVKLPYPAKRCGFYHVKCTHCDCSVAVTTAGRPDDPRSIEIPCKRRLQ
jgi:hypothetical protein